MNAVMTLASEEMILASRPAEGGFVLSEVSGRLLLLMARLTWTEEQRRVATNLAFRVDCWESLLDRAAQHFILPLANRHLRSLSTGSLPDALLPMLHGRVRQQTIGLLNVSMAQRNLVDKVLVPSGQPFMVIKGQALAGCYYDGSALRICRDVDVLVPKRALYELIRHSRSLGYRIWPNDEVSDQDLRAQIRFEPEVSLLSPEGVVVELHKQLDKSGQIFRTRPLLKKREFHSIDGMTLPVLPTAEHFVFACLHHGRHLWSHLHWLTDLNAMMGSSDFDIEHVRGFARQCGLSETVEAAIGLHEASTELAMTGEVNVTDRVGDFLGACIHHVQHGPSAEFQLRKDRPFSDFAFEWQAERHPVFRSTLRYWLWNFEPRTIDYQTLPLPSCLHWLYYFIRPFTGLHRRVRRMMQRLQRKSN
jgi:hypothetical protein